MLALQVKTSYSLLSSLCKIEDLVKKAKEYGYTSLAITDENNLYGVMPFYETCLKYNIKPIIGVELSLENKKILLYARNNKGYKNIKEEKIPEWFNKEIKKQEVTKEAREEMQNLLKEYR